MVVEVHLVLDGRNSKADELLLPHLLLDGIPTVRNTHKSFLRGAVPWRLEEFQRLVSLFLLIAAALSLVQHLVEVKSSIEGRSMVSSVTSSGRDQAFIDLF